MSKKPSRPTPARPESEADGATRASGSAGPMDPRLLEQIVKLMAANDLNTVDVRDGQRRVILKRGPAVNYAAVVGPHGFPALAPQATPAATPATGPGSPAGTSPGGASGGSEDAGLLSIKSEMVGTFYSKPSPDAKPFVSLGSQVDEETIVCVIEAMKHFNPIKAEVRGTIARVLVSDGEVVDVDKPLFLVRPN